MTTPAVPPQNSLPAGWYPDPGGEQTPYGPALRYWDGNAWTENMHAPTGPTTAPTGPGGAPYAEWWQRGLGYFLDGLFLSPFSIFAVIVMMQSMLSSPAMQELLNTPTDQPLSDAQTQALFTDMTDSMLSAVIPIAVFLTALTALYFIAMIAIWGRTLGGMVMGIKAVNNAGGVPGWLSSTKRYAVILGCSLAGTFLSFIPIVGGLLSSLGAILLLVCFLSFLWNNNRQAWQDRFAGTYVIQTRR